MQVEKAADRAGGFLGGLFGGGASKAADTVSKQASQVAETASKAVQDTGKQAAQAASKAGKEVSKAVPGKGDGASSDPDLAEKRAAAVASALKNLGKAVEDKGGDALKTVGKAVEDKGGDAVKSVSKALENEGGVAAAAEKGAKSAGKQAQSAALKVADKAEAGVSEAQEAAVRLALLACSCVATHVYRRKHGPIRLNRTGLLNGGLALISHALHSRPRMPLHVARSRALAEATSGVAETKWRTCDGGRGGQRGAGMD